MNGGVSTVARGNASLPASSALSVLPKRAKRVAAQSAGHFSPGSAAAFADTNHDGGFGSVEPRSERRRAGSNRTEVEAPASAVPDASPARV